MVAVKGTIEDELRASIATMTRAERQLASHILRNYPVSLLGSVTQLAKAADVSSPTVVRLAQKMGYGGYPGLQAALREEIESRLVGPLAKHDLWAARAPEGHMLNRFADAVMANLHATLSQIDQADFDAVAALLADPTRKIFATGGRITLAMAEYFATHMKVIRPDVELLIPLSNAWPPALLEIERGDVLLVFDIRRYENAVLQLVEMASEQGAEIVLITDPWVSPAAAHARIRLSAQVEVPSAWDSTVAIQLIVETLMAAVQALTWDTTAARMQRLEELYERARFFRGKK
ncbi:RpiR family transcriptional regulator [Rhodobacter aestuarii]|uniref:Transcriptional regulator, RpiR family n=1 Tax=Rhodobacter aestuarii TaxID=453582 RepID=A0A1N7PAH5_9RHOB|nr:MULTISPECIES: MurR/RpiR family transcriptional regulator [Rhodobacter]PTV97702.1 RpiR family transcriptional regulator [Rhodobacter aestuarii]SIT07540.1 transcriptional regulator, RpiR family [Rhodobacter aestuarii]SOC04644.1 RpiR family transcriptional regulator [Rhodobacter sp. JA431]